MNKVDDTKKDKLINIRINADDYNLFKCLCASVGSTPSEMIRVYIKTTLTPLKLKLNSGELKLDDVLKLGDLVDDENK